MQLTMLPSCFAPPQCHRSPFQIGKREEEEALARNHRRLPVSPSPFMAICRARKGLFLSSLVLCCLLSSEFFSAPSSFPSVPSLSHTYSLPSPSPSSLLFLRTFGQCSQPRTYVPRSLLFPCCRVRTNTHTLTYSPIMAKEGTTRQARTRGGGGF